jgi:hypothetical protein
LQDIIKGVLQTHEVLPNTGMCWAGKLLVHHPPGVATNFTMGVIRRIQILVGVGVITVSIEHQILPITILGGAILQKVDSVCCLIHNHQSMDRRIDIWIVNRTVSFYPLFRQACTLVLSLGVNSQVQGRWSDGILRIRRQGQGREGQGFLYLRGIVRCGILQSGHHYTLKTTTTVGRRGYQLRLLERYLDVLVKHTTEIPPPTALAEGVSLR